MKSNASLALCTATLAVLVSLVGAADEQPSPLAIKLSANISPAKNDVTVRARVTPDARSRELTIEWVADDLSGGSHAISLEGARAATTHQYTLKNMSPGRYVVTAILRLSDGTQVRRESNLLVVGPGGPDGGGASGAHGSAGGRVRPATEH